MNFSNLEITNNPQNPADWIVKGVITNDANEPIADFGHDGISVFAWWAQQDSAWQLSMVNQFVWMMAQEIVAGTAE
jgi:hypothetical protein